MLKLEATDHQYYCDHSYPEEYETFQEFKEEWVGGELDTIDLDYNLVFRYDLERMLDDDTGKELDGFELKLNYMLQRKGNHVKIIIKNIREEDLKEINPYLNKNLDYIKSLWNEFL